MNKNRNFATISQFNNAQLICSYLFLKKTAKHYYQKKLSNLFKKEKEAIIRDLALFESIRKQEYFLRCSTPQKWLEKKEVFQNLQMEIEKRELPINSFDFN